MAAAKKRYLYCLYKTPYLSDEKRQALSGVLAETVKGTKGLETESVYYIETAKRLRGSDRRKLHWFVRDKHFPEQTAEISFLGKKNVVEVRPLRNFETADSSESVDIGGDCGIKEVIRVERGERYKIIRDRELTKKEIAEIAPLIYDKMTEGVYRGKPKTLLSNRKPKPVRYIPVMSKGIRALYDANEEYGTGMDDTDIRYYYHLITTTLKRDLTDAEFLDLGNCNSEHSRHHLFRAKLVIDGKEMPFTLMGLIKSTLKNKDNAVISFYDNASAISGFKVSVLIPDEPGMPSPERMRKLLYHFVLTCETHNHPSFIQAYQGAATGRNGRGRDNEAVGRGGIPAAGTAAFLGGNLNIPGYDLPWERKDFYYSPKYEKPLGFYIKGTNGAFNDGNEFGEPLVKVRFESLGFRVGDQRLETYKPIMFSGGLGFIDARHIKKYKPKKGMLVLKLGGKAFRIGVGGGSASSVTAGQNREDLDFNSVQRANGEMAHKVDEVIRACIKLGSRNPIESIGDQGAGGNGNILKEIMDFVGGKIYLRKIPVGDPTMSTMEIWVAEYQEGMVVLVREEGWEIIKSIADREKCPCEIVGVITGDGRAVVIDEKDGTTPVDLNLKDVLGDYPRKTYSDTRVRLPLKPLRLPKRFSAFDAANLTFRLLGVASKEWAVNKADSSVTGKVVQAERVGPFGLPISDYAIIAPSYLDRVGEASSMGMRPTIGLISPEAMARMTAAEALLQLIGVKITSRRDIKSSANWMLAAKWKGGTAWLYDAVVALKDALKILGIDIDGGKDSLSLGVEITLPNGRKIKVRSLGTLILSTYVGCPNIEERVTPDLKTPGNSLVFVDLAMGKTRMGGSALAQVLGKVGDECPDMDDPNRLNYVFDQMQRFVASGKIESVKIRERGGLAAALCQMSFASGCGVDVSLEHESASVLETLYNEELGFVLECKREHKEEIIAALSQNAFAYDVGSVVEGRVIRIKHNGATVLDEDMRKLRAIWRETSYRMEEFQTVESCIKMARTNEYDRFRPAFRISFDPDAYKANFKNLSKAVKVAVLREEGSNSHEEAKAACFLAGMVPCDITMTDLTNGRIALDPFRGIIFPGGFTFKDVLGSGKGEAGVIRYNRKARWEIGRFFARSDTFALGICNGCQLMSFFGFLPWRMPEIESPALVRNQSEKFESRFVNVRILPSNSIFLEDMEESTLGIHVAHGEGRFVIPENTLKRILDSGLAPIRYVDDDGAITEQYPCNPNGSRFGIAGLSDKTGRFLFLMPHPERTVLPRQWPYWPKEWKNVNSPWLRMFINARTWCEKTKQFSKV